MAKRGYKVALVAVIATILVLGVAGFALAQGGWSDLPLSVLGKYGITAEQVGAISDGYPDGTWRPYDAMPRQQFTKMAVDAYKIPLSTATTSTFSDVPTTSLYFPFIEGAYEAGLVNGTGSGQFSPLAIVTREQAVAIISRWVAQANGYDLATYYTDAEVAALLATFPDGNAVSASLQREMAFAIDMGIIKGNAYGKLDPMGQLVRIQGGAMLIRSWAIIPAVKPPAVPAAIKLVGPDKQESLIGLTRQVTFQVTDADGNPIEGVLVDFDVLVAKWHVGNVEPQAVLTDAEGKATANIWSTEIGIENISGVVNGLKPVIVTQYWLALDEVYIMDKDLASENNAGDAHTWSARVMVFGPGPLSAGAQDWYNLISTDTTSTPADKLGIDAETLDKDSVDPSSYQDELKWAEKGYAPRSLPDIPVHWTLENYDPESATHTAETSATITAVTVDIGKIAPDKKSAWAATNATGTSTATITSDKTGRAVITVIADYEGNPYPGMLFNHETGNDFENHYDKWNSQPVYTHTNNHDTEGRHDDDKDVTYQKAVKTWIPHVIDAPGGLITPVTNTANIGEERQFKLRLLDQFGNPISYTQVHWWIKGVGFVKADLDNQQGQSGSGMDNQDLDTTNANGEADVWVKSEVPGQTIVMAEATDKYGPEKSLGSATMQWYRVDYTTFDNPSTKGDDIGDLVDKGKDFVHAVPAHQAILADCMQCHKPPKSDAPVGTLVGEVSDSKCALCHDGNEAFSVNDITGTHQFDLWVFGAKWVFTALDMNDNGKVDDAVLLGNREDIKQAEGWILLDSVNWELESSWKHKAEGVDILPGEVFTPDLEHYAKDTNNTYLLNLPSGGSDGWKPWHHWPEGAFYTRYADITLAPGEIWMDRISGFGHDSEQLFSDSGVRSRCGDGIRELWTPLKGKGVNFFSNVWNPDIDAYVNTPLSGFQEWQKDDNGDVKADEHAFVGSITGKGDPYPPVTIAGVTYKYDAMTDASGHAWVKISSNFPGKQIVTAIVDYPEMPDIRDSSKPAGPPPWEWCDDNVANALKIWKFGAVYDHIVVYEEQLTSAPTNGTPPVGAAYDKLPEGDVTMLAGLKFFNNLESPLVTRDVEMYKDKYKPTAKFHVVVYDKFGNELPGYKVQFQLLPEPGATDGMNLGPWAYFKDAKSGRENEPEGYLKYSGVPRRDSHDPELREDIAVAWTEGRLIDGAVDRYSGARVDLVLGHGDEVDLDNNVNRINVMVNDPSGKPINVGNGSNVFQITKVWGYEQVLTKMVLEEKRPEPATTWTTDGLTFPVFYDIRIRVQMLDQYGAPMRDTPFPDARIMIAGVSLDFNDGDTTDANGYLTTTYPPQTAGTLTMQAWNDSNGNSQIGSGEIQSGVKTDTIQPNQ